MPARPLTLGMYLPRHFTVTDLAQITAFVDAAQSADLVTFDGTKPVSTLLPVIWDRPPSGELDSASDGNDSGGGEARLGRLLGHIAIANQQWKTALPGAHALAIVRGPQAYISPSWYESKARHGRVVPTWNYEAVHLTGPIAFHQDPEWLRAFVTRLTQAARRRPRASVGGHRCPARVHRRTAAGDRRRRADHHGDRGQAEAQPESQRPDREGVVTGLRGEPDAGPAAIADAMAAQLAGSVGS